MFLASFLGNMGLTFARCHNKWLWRPQTNKSNRNFTVTGGISVSCLDRARTANLGTENLRRRIIRIYHWFKTQTSTLAFELDCDSQLNNPLSPTLWSLHELNVFAKMNAGNFAGIDSLDKHVEQISFRLCVLFTEHRQLKGWQPLFQPTVAKSSISTMVHWFAEVTCHNWKRNILKSKSWIPQLYLLHAWCKHSADRVERAAALRDLKLFGRESRQFVIASWPLLNGNVGPTFARCHDATTNGLGDHKPKRSKKSNVNFTVTGMSMSCLDRARTANFGYLKFTTKNHSNPSLIHNSNIDPGVRVELWLPTQ